MGGVRAIGRQMVSRMPCAIHESPNLVGITHCGRRNDDGVQPKLPVRTPYSWLPLVACGRRSGFLCIGGEIQSTHHL